MDNYENMSLFEARETQAPMENADSDLALNVDTAIPEASHEQARGGNEYDDDLPLKKRRSKLKIIITIFVLLLAAAATYYYLQGRISPAVQAQNEYTYYTVGRRDISSTLSGSGTLSPADSYSVTSLVSGEILWADFEEGDIVNKNDPLYKIDSSDAQTSIEQAENSLAQSQKSYTQKEKSLADLQIRSNTAGSVINMSVKPGDKLSAGQIVATIRDSRTMELTIPFGSDDAQLLSVGQTAEVVLDGNFERLTGTISKIGALDEMLAGSMIVRMVTIDVANPGGLSISHVATASVGSIYSNGSGSFGYKAEETVNAATSGEVVAVYSKEGDWVQNDALMVQLKSDSLTNDLENSANSLRNEELSLENKYKQLDNYAVKSPIAGTIIEKYYKEGDNLDAGRTLCMIYDLSYLTMTLNVDELDIAGVKVGQNVAVTAEALGDTPFEGVVTRININGNTVNGVTSYPVTIRIDKTEGLLPGMNVQAEIVVSYSQNTLAIPVSALSRGNRVLVKTEGRPAAQSDSWTPQTDGGTPQLDGGDGSETNSGARPQFNGSGGAPQFDGSGGGAPQFNGSGDAPQFNGDGTTPQFDGARSSMSGTRPPMGEERTSTDGTISSSDSADPIANGGLPVNGAEQTPGAGQAPSAGQTPDDELQSAEGSTSQQPGGERIQSSQPGNPGAGQDGLPEGYEYVFVTIGVSDDYFIEITSGLYEGDEIAYIPDTGSTGDFFFPAGNSSFGVNVVGGGAVPVGGGAIPGGRQP